MRMLTGAGTPSELRARGSAWFGVVVMPNDGFVVLFVRTVGDQTAVLAVSLKIDPYG